MDNLSVKQRHVKSKLRFVARVVEKKRAKTKT